jgi:trehalose-6-phosphatase
MGITPSILERSPLATLQAFTLGNVLLAFDYEGTLAPAPAGATLTAMRGDTRALLAAVAQRYPCVVLSHQSEADLAARLSGVPVWDAQGGIEGRGDGRRSKSTVLRAAIHQFACQSALYVGDDDAEDEEVFRSVGPDLFSIKVGSSPRSSARYRLDSQLDIDGLLFALMSLREPATSITAGKAPPPRPGARGGR